MSTVTTASGQAAQRPIITFLQTYGPHLALFPGLVAMLGSLYYSEIAGFVPCNLCWYQRIVMYPLWIFIMIGIIREDEGLPTYILPFSIFGMLMAGYHYLLQWGLVPNVNSCGSLSCGERYVEYLGFITIPFLSLTAFTLITIAMAATYWANKQADTQE